MHAPNGKLFYGWYIVAVTALGICFGYVGTIIYAFSIFILPLTGEFGWSRGAISLGLSLSNITMMLCAPIIGAMIDRAGVKRILLPSTFCFGLILCSFYFLTPHVWHFYLAIILLTALGSGTASVGYVRLLVTWFDRKKGLALALGTSGAGIAAIILPPLVTRLIAAFGWREAYVFLGLANLLLIVPLIGLFLRNSPADIGDYPDGRAPESRDVSARGAGGPDGYRFSECLRIATFWKLAAATALLGMTLTGAISQLIPLLVDRGVARADAGHIASLLGLSVIGSRLLSGYCMDRLHAPFVAGTFLIFPVAGFAAAALMPGTTTAALAVVCLGIGLGLEFDAIGFFCAQYFGRLAVGKTYGVMFLIFNIGGGTGVYLAGHSYDLFSSYSVALLAASVLTLLAIFITVSLGSYPRAGRKAELAAY